MIDGDRPIADDHSRKAHHSRRGGSNVEACRVSEVDSPVALVSSERTERIGDITGKRSAQADT